MEGSFAEWEATEVQREQQEMDIFAEEEEKMGRTIYDPSTWRENAWPENSREAWKNWENTAFLPIQASACLDMIYSPMAMANDSWGKQIC